MSTIGTPEIPAAYGAIDSTAFSDGMPYSAHVLREMVRSANRIASKGQHLLCLPFLVEQAADPDTYPDGFMIRPPVEWTRIVPPLPLPKKPGLTRAEIRVRARIQDSTTIKLAVGTRAAPFDPMNVVDRDNILIMAGDGDNDIDSYGSTLDSPGIPIHEGDIETIELWIKTNGDGGAVTTSGGDGAVTPVSFYRSAASWASATWSGRAHIRFYDAAGVPIVNRSIASVSSDLQTVYWLQPGGTLAGDIVDAINDSIAGAGTAWEVIITNAEFSLSSFAMAAKPRTT